jgi:hypothetical protein
MVRSAVQTPRDEDTDAGNRVLKGTVVHVSGEPRVLSCPGLDAEAKLTVQKQDGAVRGFSYRCTCGRTEHFICD